MVKRLFEQLETVFSDAHWSRPDGVKRVADQKVTPLPISGRNRRGRSA